MKDAEQNTPLHAAAENGHVECLRILLECTDPYPSSDTPARTEEEETSPLDSSLAVFFRLDSEDEKLLPIVDVENEFEETPLHLACTYSHPDCVRLLLSKKANVIDAKSDLKRTPLHFAALCRDPECTEILLSCESIEIDPQDKDGDTPLALAASKYFSY